MKNWKLTVAVAAVVVVSAAQLLAAPVSSVESARATAQAKVDAFLGEQVVVAKLAELGVSRDEARLRVAQLSDAQLLHAAAQVDLLRAAGTIESSGTNWGAGCVFKAIGTFFENIFRLLFCWRDLK